MIKRNLFRVLAGLAAMVAVTLGLQNQALAVGVHGAWWCDLTTVCMYSNLSGEGQIIDMNYIGSHNGVTLGSNGANRATSISTNAGNTRDLGPGVVFWFFDAPNCTGDHMTMAPGNHLADLREVGYNDKISSFAMNTVASGLGPCSTSDYYVLAD